MDEEADEADDEEHNRREVVELEAQRNGKVAEAQPFHRGSETFTAEDEVERYGGERGGDAHGDQRRDSTLSAQEEGDDRGRNQGQQEDEEGLGDWRHGVSASGR